MPCYQMNVMAVEFLARNVDMLLRALDALKLKYVHDGMYITVGRQVQIDLERQTAEYERYQAPIVNAIKRQYAREVINEVAKRKRWVVKQQSKRKLQLKKY